LGHYIPFQTALERFRVLWSIWVVLGRFESFLGHFGAIWSVLFCFEQF
jgi:hypothetical protein